MRKLLYGVSFILCGWCLLSFIDVLTHNLTDYTYAGWNVFTLLF